jgi:hypothetical protein
MGEMKPWPVMKAVEEMTVAEYLGNIPELDYERARAEAAIERLRVAVEALKAVQLAKPNEYYYVEVDEALSVIGDVPGDK